MNSRQSGFTLVEIAIVLVIIGLLLGGVLKGQELINSAKVKNIATDFRNIPLFVYGYQDKFKALPGDHEATRLAAAIPTATPASTPAGGVRGNGVIEGAWNSTAVTDESVLFWQHVRLAGLAAGPTAAPTTATIEAFRPANADGGIIGITSGVNTPITAMGGTYIVCSEGILGKYAKQLDTTLDDGVTTTGSVRTMPTQARNQATAVAAADSTSAGWDDATSYTVCMSL